MAENQTHNGKIDDQWVMVEEPKDHEMHLDHPHPKKQGGESKEKEENEGHENKAKEKKPDGAHKGEQKEELKAKESKASSRNKKKEKPAAEEEGKKKGEGEKEDEEGGKPRRTTRKAATAGQEKPQIPKVSAGSKVTKAKDRAPAKKGRKGGVTTPIDGDDTTKTAEETKGRDAEMANAEEQKEAEAEPGSEEEKKEDNEKEKETKAVHHPKPKTKPGHLPIPDRSSTVGFVFGAGSNPTGELGVHPDEIQQKLRPMPIKGLEGLEIVDIACGGMHTMVLTKDGRLFSWGNNDEKALGRSGPEYEPKEVEGLEGIEIVQVVCSDSASFALSDAGVVYGCGTFRDDNGVMGFSEDVRNQATMIEVKTLKNFRIVRICCGPNSCTALSSDGLVYTFGCGRQEAGSEKDGNQMSVNLLGRGRSLRGRSRTLNAAALNFGNRKDVGKIVKIFSGAYHHFAISEKGEVFAWGLNNFGQTGIGHQKNLDEPTKIESLSKLDIAEIAAGALHTLALSKSGSVYSFGQGLDAQLGIGKEIEALLEPTEIPEFGASNPVISIACGPQSSAAVTRDGNMYTWGSNLCGQLATGDDENQSNPFHVKTKNRTVYKVSCGGQFTMIFASDKKEDVGE